MKKDLLSIQDFSRQDLDFLFELSSNLKNDSQQFLDILKGKSVGLLFQKPSNRTRVSFEVGIWHLGGNCIYLGPDEINLGKRESIEDVSKTLSRYLSSIVARTNSHEDLKHLAHFSSIPVINGLSDLVHPCQALADFFTIKEKFKQFSNVLLAYIGDGNNVCHSLLIGAAKLGMNINVATPKGYEPLEAVVKIAQSHALQTGAKINLTNTPQDAVRGANIIYTDVWISMGQEEQAGQRLNVFQEYQINKELALYAHKDYIFMHCLPAHRGQEVTADIIDGNHSIVFDQAENRLHIQKSILIKIIGDLG